MPLNENQVDIIMQACYAVLGIHAAAKVALEQAAKQATEEGEEKAVQIIGKIIEAL